MARIAIVGPGAVGRLAAASLEATGRHEIVLCGRRDAGPRRVRLPDGAWLDLAAPVITDPAEWGGTVPGSRDRPADWVLLAVKAHQTAGAAAWLHALCSPDTTVLVLQNGVDHVERVAPLAPGVTVVPAIVWIDVEAGDDAILCRDGSRVVVPDGAAGRACAALFAGGFVAIDPAPDFAVQAWEKLCWNAVTSLQALSGRGSEMFAAPAVQDLARRLAAECVAVARAEGALIPPARAGELVDRIAGRGYGSRASILLDRLAGRPLEWEARNDVVRRLGARHGIPTPVSDVVVPLLIAASGDDNS